MTSKVPSSMKVYSLSCLNHGWLLSRANFKLRLPRRHLKRQGRNVISKNLERVYFSAIYFKISVEKTK